MLIHRSRKPISWLLIVTLTIVASVNEGLHYIPGFGHATPEGDGYFLLGIDVPQDARSPSPETRIAGKTGPSIPIYDEAECPICAAGQARSLFGEVASCELAELLVCDVPMSVYRSNFSAIARSSRPRAPPIG